MSLADRDDVVTIDDLLDQSRDPDPLVRKDAVRQLCPCNLKFDSEEVWLRLYQMADDEDVGVRKIVFHDLTDGLPRHRTERAVEVLQRMRNDPFPKLRKNVRKTLDRYRRTGSLNH